MDQKKAIRQLKLLEKNPRDMRLAAEEWKNNFEILVSTILSARTRDEVTIPVAEKLFRSYPNSKKLAGAGLKDVKRIINPVNFMTEEDVKKIIRGEKHSKGHANRES